MVFLTFSCLKVLLLIISFFNFPKTDSVLYCYTSIFSFGDSVSDTGNKLIAHPTSHVGNPPYGESYFPYPTGRFSDGRLIVDFIAQAFDLPFILPSLSSSTGQDFRQGANFAYGGATVLDESFYHERNFSDQQWPNSLGIQLHWFKQVLASLCSTSTDCRNHLRRSLFVVGSFGNDLEIFVLNKRSIEETKAVVPIVVKALISAIKTLISHGAVTLVIPGYLPLGCTTATLTLLESPYEEDYDPQTGCLKKVNELVQYYNHQLRYELDQMRSLYPHVTIIYADYYNASMRIYRSQHEFGFSKDLQACCGAGGGRYNVDPLYDCGDPGVKAYGDPRIYVNWDNYHVTERVYRSIANSLLDGPDAIPPISIPCPAVLLNETRNSQFEYPKYFK